MQIANRYDNRWFKCKLKPPKNDSVRTRLPIQAVLLELILFELERIYLKSNQIYLEKLFKAIFILGYYGLMHAGELLKTEEADHAVRAKNFHIGSNKRKLLIVLYSSKTHHKGNIPQKIKITESQTRKQQIHRHFCPFKVLNEFISVRGSTIQSDEEHFFIYKDRTPVCVSKARSLLKLVLHNLGLNENLYGLHSLRIGRCTDLMKFNYEVSVIKRLARLRSNVVYKYLHP